MKSIRMLFVVLALVLIGVLVAGEAGQTQDRGGSEPAAVQSGTAEGTSAAPTGGPVRQLEVQPDPSASYNASIRIPVAGLKPRTSDAEWQVGGQGGCTFAASGNQNTWWSTPLYLPDGSILRYFRMYYNDQNTTYDSAAYLSVYDLYGDLVTEWGIFSSIPGQNYATTEQLDHEIDYALYNYVINWRPNVLGSSMQVCGFRVYYEYTWGLAFLPDIQKEY